MVTQCCFCKKPLKGHGNDPYPADKSYGHKCCDECNLNIVIPKRLQLLKGEIPE